jgi:hypothetical protein
MYGQIARRSINPEACNQLANYVRSVPNLMIIMGLVNARLFGWVYSRLVPLICYNICHVDWWCYLVGKHPRKWIVYTTHRCQRNLFVNLKKLEVFSSNYVWTIITGLWFASFPHKKIVPTLSDIFFVWELGKLITG